MSVLYALLPKLTGFTPVQAMHINSQSPYALISAAITMQGALNISMYGLSAFLFAHLAHPEKWQYLRLVRPGKKMQPVLAVLAMLGAMPLLTLIQHYIGLIDFGPKVREAQQLNDELFTAFLTMPSFGAFLHVFVVLAIIPGVGEELFFRSVLMRFTRKKTFSMVVPILFTSAVFAYSHSNVYGLLSIFLAGLLLAGLFYLTGSLWCSILPHIFFNGSQVILSYAGHKNAAVQKFVEGTEVSWPIVIVGAVIFAASFYLLWKNRTPLPQDWTQDYKNDAEREAERA